MTEADGLFDEVWLVNLDVIPGEKGKKTSQAELAQATEQSDRNLATLQSEFGDHILPVFHQDEGKERLLEIVDQAKGYLCLSPFNNKPEEDRWRWAALARSALFDLESGVKYSLKSMAIVSCNLSVWCRRMKKSKITLYHITAGWMLLTVFTGIYFLFNGMKPSADVDAQHENNFHRVWIADVERGDIKQFRVDRQPIVIWRRDSGEIAEAMTLLEPTTSLEKWLSLLNDGTLAFELGSEKFSRLEWFAVSLVNTGGIGCVVLTKAGDYGGFFDPCQGAHFDLWGRIQKGPTTQNLKVAPIKLAEDGQSVLIDLTEMPKLR